MKNKMIIHGALFGLLGTCNVMLGMEQPTPDFQSKGNYSEEGTSTKRSRSLSLPTNLQKQDESTPGALILSKSHPSSPRTQSPEHRSTNLTQLKQLVPIQYSVATQSAMEILYSKDSFTCPKITHIAFNGQTQHYDHYTDNNCVFSLDAKKYKPETSSCYLGIATEDNAKQMTYFHIPSTDSDIPKTIPFFSNIQCKDNIPQDDSSWKISNISYTTNNTPLLIDFINSDSQEKCTIRANSIMLKNITESMSGAGILFKIGGMDKEIVIKSTQEVKDTFHKLFETLSKQPVAAVQPKFDSETGKPLTNTKAEETSIPCANVVPKTPPMSPRDNDSDESYSSESDSSDEKQAWVQKVEAINPNASITPNYCITKIESQGDNYIFTYEEIVQPGEETKEKITEVLYATNDKLKEIREALLVNRNGIIFFDEKSVIFTFSDEAKESLCLPHVVTGISAGFATKNNVYYITSIRKLANNATYIITCSTKTNTEGVTCFTELLLTEEQFVEMKKLLLKNSIVKASTEEKIAVVIDCSEQTTNAFNTFEKDKNTVKNTEQSTLPTLKSQSFRQYATLKNAGGIFVAVGGFVALLYYFNRLPEGLTQLPHNFVQLMNKVLFAQK